MKAIASVIAMVLAMVISFVPSTAQAAYGDQNGRMFIVGDSITAWYDDTVGSDDRGWWSFLSRANDYVPMTNAYGGSGFLSQSTYCTYPNFRNRINAIRTADAQQHITRLIIEGGRNDWRNCEGVRYSEAAQEKYIGEYMAEIKAIKAELGIPRVHAVLPWGPNMQAEKNQIYPIVQAAAHANGITFKLINLTQDQTLDGTHPNLAGNLYISRTLDEIYFP